MKSYRFVVHLSFAKNGGAKRSNKAFFASKCLIFLTQSFASLRSAIFSEIKKNNQKWRSSPRLRFKDDFLTSRKFLTVEPFVPMIAQAWQNSQLCFVFLLSSIVRAFRVFVLQNFCNLRNNSVQRFTTRIIDVNKTSKIIKNIEILYLRGSEASRVQLHYDF